MRAYGPMLETPRLTLRPPQVEDFARYAELLADEQACRYIGGHQPRAGAWRRFLQMPGAWALQGFAMFSVLDKTDGRWLGQLGPWRPEGWPGNEIGYSFHRDAWGQGYATEAAVAAMDCGLSSIGLGNRHPLHRPRQSPLAKSRNAAGVNAASAASIAGAV